MGCVLAKDLADCDLDELDELEDEEEEKILLQMRFDGLTLTYWFLSFKAIECSYVGVRMITYDVL